MPPSVWDGADQSQFRIGFAVDEVTVIEDVDSAAFWSQFLAVRWKQPGALVEVVAFGGYDASIDPTLISTQRDLMRGKLKTRAIGASCLQLSDEERARHVRDVHHLNATLARERRDHRAVDTAAVWRHCEGVRVLRPNNLRHPLWIAAVRNIVDVEPRRLVIG